METMSVLNFDTYQAKRCHKPRQRLLISGAITNPTSASFCT
jgi:hypothetical protein